MTDDDFASFDADDIPRFAPNFSVYSQASNIVCLYSEDRKFLLHGELNCALAAAIAKGGKSFRQLVRVARAGFSSRQYPQSPEAADRPPLHSARVALFRQRFRRLLG